MTDDKDALLREMRTYAEANEVPVSQRETSAFLQFLCAVKQPKRILEIGTAIGYSAIAMAKNCQAEIVTLERDEAMITTAKDYICRAGLENRITIIEGDATKTLSRVSGEFDLVFIDAAKGQYETFLNQITVSHGGILVCDNVLYKGMTATDELVVRRKITIVKRLREFLKELMNDENYVTSLLPLGDGVALACKKGCDKNE
ncbi:MAG: O-methyltransferase [Ruminococcaceae bacterium]|nr:O-methyltransferase [Oscillospiraceae bacterium]